MDAQIGAAITIAIRQALKMLKLVRSNSDWVARSGEPLGCTTDSSRASRIVCAMFHSMRGHPPQVGCFTLAGLLAYGFRCIPPSQTNPPWLGYDPSSGVRAYINHLQLRVQLRVCFLMDTAHRIPYSTSAFGLGHQYIDKLLSMGSGAVKRMMTSIIF